MAKAEVTIFNLGSSQVSASKFSIKQKNLFLEKFQLIELPITTDGELEWINGVGQAVDELSSKWGFKSEASFVLPSSIILSKTLRVPKVETDKQRKVIEFELSQKMPFPLDSLIWDFLVIDDDGIEQEILSFAIKPDLLEKLSQVIFRSGVIPLSFTPASAIDNCSIPEDFRGDGEESLLINFGAKSTNLTFFSTSGFLLRSLNLGGWNLTDSIANAFGVNHAKAEEIKKNHTSFIEKNNDSTVSILHANHENFLNKCMQEISRSIVTYKRLKKGRTPTQLIITGRTTKTPNLVDFLAQSQALPIKYFDPYSQITISESIDAPNRNLLPFVISEILGLANLLLGNIKGSVINLMPQAKLRHLENKKKYPWYLCAALVISIIPLPWYLNVRALGEDLVKDDLTLAKQISELSGKLDLSLKENTDLDILKTVNKSARQQIVLLESLSKKVFFLQELLNNLQTKIGFRLNHNTWIDSFEFLIPPSASLTDPNNSNVKDIVRITGRYLVKPESTKKDQPEDNRRLSLIELSGEIQEFLSKSIASMPQVSNVRKKTFSIEGKGDLYNRQFTHFEFDLLLDSK